MPGLRRAAPHRRPAVHALSRAMAAAGLKIELSPSNFRICGPQCEPTGVIGAKTRSKRAGSSHSHAVTGGPMTLNTCSVTSLKDKAMTNSQ